METNTMRRCIPKETQIPVGAENLESEPNYFNPLEQVPNEEIHSNPPEKTIYESEENIASIERNSTCLGIISQFCMLRTFEDYILFMGSHLD
tara:strand:- start:254 stop:529 length:276 start_codon:yes stop_codon:yes gene_type:complete